VSEDRLVVRIGPERLCARIDSIPPGVAVNDVLAALRANDIGMGICHDAIADAVRRANETGEPVRQLVAARGLHPRAPASATSSFRLPGALTEVPDLEYVTSAWTVSRTAGLARACRGIAVWLVKPGDALWAAVVDYGEPGVNLLGGVTPPPRPPRPSSPPVGDGVELAANGSLCTARRFGFAGWLEGRLTVLPPVWIDARERVAMMVRLPAHGAAVSPPIEGLRDAIRAAGVVVDLDPDGLRVAAMPWPTVAEPSADPLVRVAAAIPPTPPRPGEPSFFFEHEFRVGSEREGGRTDFKDRNIFPSVVADTLLAECPLTVPGQPGTSVRGRSIPPGKAPATLLEALENVHLVTEDRVQRVYAERDGGATVRRRVLFSRAGRTTRYQIAVRTVARLASDVDLETGHVRFDGNVEVAGSVRAGFELLANGDIVVKGRVEAGARLGAHGNITVLGGIVGPETRISARGTVKARFIQAARVRAGHDLKVASYCHEAEVEAGGVVLVQGRGGRGDGIVGGLVWAAGDVEASNLGSASNPNTVVVAGVNRALVARHDELEAELKRSDRELKRLLHRIGVPDPQALAVIFVDPEADDPRSQLLWSAQEHVAAGAAMAAELEAVRAEMQELAAVASVIAKRTAFPGTRVRVGPFATTVEKEIHGVRYHLDPEGERGGVLTTPASAKRRPKRA